MSFSKLPKTPALSKKTKLLSFDLETNGLHGPAFAVGAVIMDYDGNVIEEFSARCDIQGEVDEWVQQRVIPVIENMPVTHKSYKDLRQAFWDWYVPAEATADYVLVSHGYPVEYRFLLECQQDNIEERYWQHPFPILELSSLLIQLDQKPQKGISGYTPHHPVDDAKVAAITAFKAFELSGRIA